jgi:hypothetical protein
MVFCEGSFESFALENGEICTFIGLVLQIFEE